MKRGAFAPLLALWFPLLAGSPRGTKPVLVAGDGVDIQAVDDFQRREMSTHKFTESELALLQAAPTEACAALHRARDPGELGRINVPYAAGAIGEPFQRRGSASVSGSSQASLAYVEIAVEVPAPNSERG